MASTEKNLKPLYRRLYELALIIIINKHVRNKALCQILLYTIALTHKWKYTLNLEVYYATKIKDMFKKTLYEIWSSRVVTK